jgi:ubiquinone/menaquinone biosynthesis C-methylase UbiE
MTSIPVRYPDPDLLIERESSGYDETAQGLSDQAREIGGPNRALFLERAGIAPGQRVLDVCCGGAWLAIDAARAVAPGGHVTGIELSAAMVAVAQTNVREAGVDNVEVRQGDAQELPLDDASFDRAVCHAGLMHVPDPARALSELARVLVPGGRLVANVWGPEGETVIDAVADALADAGEPLTLDYRYLLRLGNADLLEGLARDAGFAEAEATQATASIPAPDAADWWDAFRDIGGLFRGLIDELSPAGAARARASFLERSAQVRTDEGYALPIGQFVLVAVR